jgi:hypothetical protein
MKPGIKCLGVLAVGAAGIVLPRAAADEWDEQTILTFNRPVEIHGKVLPAGAPFPIKKWFYPGE